MVVLLPCTAAFLHHQNIGLSFSHHLRTFQSPNCSPKRPRERTQITNLASAAKPVSPSSRDQNSASSTSNVNTPPPPSGGGPVWESLCGCQVVAFPSTVRPVAIVRFTGGFGAGSAPRTLYGKFLEEVARQGNVAVIAAPLNPSFDHLRLAGDAAEMLGAATRDLLARWDAPWVPTFGMGHSLGAKVQLLASCDEAARQVQGPSVANLLLCFNNFTAKQSIPMWDAVRAAVNQTSTQKSVKELGKVAEFLRSLDLSGLSGGTGPDSINNASEILRKIADTFDSLSSTATDEFSPTPEETLDLVRTRYGVPDNLLVSFSRDSLDQNAALEQVLLSRFGKRGIVVRQLAGTHVTPLTPDLGEKATGGFASVGSPSLDEEIRKAAGSVSTELNATVAVVVAFLRLHLEVLAEKRMLP